VSQSTDDRLGGLEPAEVLLRFLKGVGTGSEAEFYLRLFRSWPRERFATIAVLSDAVDDAGGSVTFDLRLLRHLGLTPVVVFGLDGLQRVAGRVEQLAQDAAAAGVDVVTMPMPASREEIAAATQVGRIPFLVAVGAESAQRQVDLARTVSALATHKLIFLRAAGGLRLGREGLNVVNLTTEAAALCDDGRLTPADRGLLRDIRRLVPDMVPHRLLVSVASPLNLLHELFTVRGAGTLLRKGARITRHDGYTGVDVGRLTELIDSSFGRTLHPAFFATPPHHTYIADVYRGVALVGDCPLGSYLTKFAVTREAQGEGIGQDLWNAVTTDHPTLIWRARRDNPVRAWYERQAHGRFETDTWTVYARGLRAGQMGAAVEFAAAQPVDFG
jgi:acetylglutamate kinase